MVFFSSRISPFTSTVIFLDRSPVATAFVTSAMLRTWAVRFPAMKFTLSVRSFHVPATPRTSAWPPSFPSVPTSRATRVTSEAKERSWSTIVLMVSFSSRISPFTSTVIFFERLPIATAVVTSAMLRTWPVRLRAIELTLSVRSFHVPATPFTSAWPPSFPSVPTSRATRVTSEANERSWSTIRFTVLALRRNSPWRGRSSKSSAIACERSPRATAPITRAISLVGWTRSPISAFTEPSEAPHAPLKPPSSARWVILPSLPTTRERRSSSRAIFSFSSMTSFSASEMRPAIPVHSTGSRTEKLPFLRAVRAESRTFWSIPSCVRPSRALLFASARDRFPSAGLRRSGGAVDEWGKPLLLIVVSCARRASSAGDHDEKQRLAPLVDCAARAPKAGARKAIPRRGEQQRPRGAHARRDRPEGPALGPDRPQEGQLLGPAAGRVDRDRRPHLGRAERRHRAEREDGARARTPLARGGQGGQDHPPRRAGRLQRCVGRLARLGERADRRPRPPHQRDGARDRRGRARRPLAGDGARPGRPPSPGRVPAQRQDREPDGGPAPLVRLRGDARRPRGRYRGEARRPGGREGRRGHVERPDRQRQLDGVQPDRPGAQHRRGDDRGRDRRPLEEDHRRRGGRDA